MDDFLNMPKFPILDLKEVLYGFRDFIKTPQYAAKKVKTDQNHLKNGIKALKSGLLVFLYIRAVNTS